MPCRAPEGRKQIWGCFRPSGAAPSFLRLIPGLASGATCFRHSVAQDPEHPRRLRLSAVRWTTLGASRRTPFHSVAVPPSGIEMK